MLVSYHTKHHSGNQDGQQGVMGQSLCHHCRQRKVRVPGNQCSEWHDLMSHVLTWEMGTGKHATGLKWALNGLLPANSSSNDQLIGISTTAAATVRECQGVSRERYHTPLKGSERFGKRKYCLRWVYENRLHYKACAGNHEEQEGW